MNRAVVAAAALLPEPRRVGAYSSLEQLIQHQAEAVAALPPSLGAEMLHPQARSSAMPPLSSARVQALLLVVTPPRAAGQASSAGHRSSVAVGPRRLPHHCSAHRWLRHQQPHCSVHRRLRRQLPLEASPLERQQRLHLVTAPPACSAAVWPQAASSEAAAASSVPRRRLAVLEVYSAAVLRRVPLPAMLFPSERELSAVRLLAAPSLAVAVLLPPAVSFHLALQRQGAVEMVL